jgi:hypothetical protein
VPRVDRRPESVVDAHMIGHFRVDGTLRRLQEKYYWKGMIKDVTRICKSCSTCCRLNDSIPLDSLARPSKVSGVLEKVGMDTVGISSLVARLPLDSSDNGVPNEIAGSLSSTGE